MLWLKKRKPAFVPRLAPGLRVYAIGDVHGRADLLGELLRMINQDLAEHPAETAKEIFLGDYIDRGPATREVVELLANPVPGRDRICLSGNHEQILRDFLISPEIVSTWRFLGGISTLASYGIESELLEPPMQSNRLRARLLELMPEGHHRFFHTLPASISLDDYFFVHAGVRPDVPIAEQAIVDMMNIRETFLRSEKDFGAFVVHGHTPVEEPEIRPNRINIDTGAFATGRLTCLVLEGESRRFLQTGQHRGPA